MKHKIDIRKATAKDLNDILRLNQELFKKEYREYDKSLDMRWTSSQRGRSYFKNRISQKDGFVSVAVIDGKIIGYLCGGFREHSYRKKAKYAELENMIVEKKMRGKEIGEKLAQEFLKWCKENKANYISVTAAAGNKAGIDFYRRLGFKDYNLTLEKKL